jgi:hypothetical protein
MDGFSKWDSNYVNSEKNFFIIMDAYIYDKRRMMIPDSVQD